MADKLDEILDEIKGANAHITQLKSWLYGADGHEGDVPEIKKQMSNHGKRISRIELIIVGLVASGGLTGGIIGLIKLLG